MWVNITKSMKGLKYGIFFESQYAMSVNQSDRKSALMVYEIVLGELG